jgi:hypothetical protein
MIEIWKFIKITALTDVRFRGKADIGRTPSLAPRATDPEPTNTKTPDQEGNWSERFGMTGIFKTTVRAQLTRSDAPATLAS